MVATFKVCGSCGRDWPDWRQFLLDAGVRLLGLQVVPSMPEANLVVFEDRCGTTVSVLASRLRPWMGVAEDGEHPLLYGSEACEKHCRRIEDIAVCDRPCLNHRDRELTARIARVKAEGTLAAMDEPLAPLPSGWRGGLDS